MAAVLLVACADSTITLIDLKTKQVILKHSLPDSVSRMKLSRDGSRLFAASGDCIYELETEVKNKVNCKYQATGHIEDICLNEGEHRVYACSTNHVLIWQEGQKTYTQMVEYDHPKTCIDFMPTENVILTGDNQGSMHSWNIRTMTPESEQNQFSSRIRSVAVSPTNNWICAGNSSGNILQYAYNEKQYRLANMHNDEEKRDVWKCIFPRESPNESLIAAFGNTIAEYTPRTDPMRGGVVTWSEDVASKMQEIHPIEVNQLCDLTTFAANQDASLIYTGHVQGVVACYTPMNKQMALMPVNFGGSYICSLAFHGAIRPESPNKNGSSHASS